MNPPNTCEPPADRATSWLRRRLGRAVLLTCAAGLLLPRPGLWLRRPHALPLGGPAGPTLHTAALLLSLMLFSAGLQVPLRALGHVLRHPKAVLAGLALHLTIPLLVVPFLAFLLHRVPGAGGGGGGLLSAVILIVAVPVAAGATVWTAKGDGDQPTMVGLILGSTLLSPLTAPLVLAALTPLLSGGYAHRLTGVGGAAGSAFTVAAVVLPCATGVLCVLVLPPAWRERLLGAVVPSAMAGSLILNYVNASGAFGSFLARPRPALFATALTVAALVCLLSFLLGRTAARALRLDASVASSLTLACGMNNSSASAVLITTALPDQPELLLPVVAYGLLQQAAAHRVVTGARSGSGAATEP